jgi:hypothetical protein
LLLECTNVVWSDLAWILKQLGVDTVGELMEKDASKIWEFVAVRRKHGQDVAEQWEQWNKLFQ